LTIPVDADEIEQVFALSEPDAIEPLRRRPVERRSARLQAVEHRPHPCGRRSTRRARSLRERISSALAAVLVLGAGAVGVGVVTANAIDRWSGVSLPAKVVVVQPGQSLWSLALEVDPRSDPRRVVGLLRAELGTDVIHPGEVVRVPR